jgi:hypothetical protein
MTAPEPFLARLKRRWMTELWLVIYFVTLLAFVIGYAVHHRPIPANERAAIELLQRLATEGRNTLPGEPTTLEHGVTVLTHAGYHIVIYRLDRTTGWVPDITPAGPGEQFVAYAWPVQVGLTGNRAFAKPASSSVLATANRGFQQYSGDDLPSPQACQVWFDSLIAGPGLDSTFAFDGFLWTSVE